MSDDGGPEDAGQGEGGGGTDAAGSLDAAALAACGTSANAFYMDIEGSGVFAPTGPPTRLVLLGVASEQYQDLEVEATTGTGVLGINAYADLFMSPTRYAEGPDPMGGKSAYVDPVTGEQRVLIPGPHAHVNDPAGNRLGPGGQVVPSESPDAHLPIRKVP